MITTTKDVKVSKARCRIGDNVFFLITETTRCLIENGFEAQAEAMRKRIEAEANSPDDVLQIVQEYVVLE